MSEGNSVMASFRKNKQQPPLPPAPRLPEPPLASDPRVHQFLMSFTQQQDTLSEQRKIIEGHELHIHKLENRVLDLESALADCSRKRDEYQTGFFEQRAMIAVLVTNAVSALEGVIKCAQGLDTNVKERMASVEQGTPIETPPAGMAEALGMKPDEEPQAS